MPAGILENDAMLSGRGLVPWHGLGTVIEGLTSFEGALDLAKLRWTVSLRKIRTDDAEALEVPGRLAIVRDDTREVFGVVSEEYQPLQNERLAKFGADLVDTSDPVVDTAGSLWNGRKVWFLIKLPKEIRVGGKDQIIPYVVLANGHDGGTAVHVRATPVRVVCNNTLTCALAGHGAYGFSLHHRLTLEGRIEEARKALKLTFAYYDEFGRFMEELAHTPFSEAQFEVVAKKLIPDPPDPNKLSEVQRENLARQRLALVRTYQVAPTVDRGTAYGAFNAATLYYDHVRDADRKWTDAGRSSKVSKLWFGEGVEWKQNALDWIKQFALVR